MTINKDFHLCKAISATWACLPNPHSDVINAAIPGGVYCDPPACLCTWKQIYSMYYGHEYIGFLNFGGSFSVVQGREGGRSWDRNKEAGSKLLA